MQFVNNPFQCLEKLTAAELLSSDSTITGTVMMQSALDQRNHFHITIALLVSLSSNTETFWDRDTSNHTG